MSFAKVLRRRLLMGRNDPKSLKHYTNKKGERIHRMNARARTYQEKEWETNLHESKTDLFSPGFRWIGSVSENAESTSSTKNIPFIWTFAFVVFFFIHVRIFSPSSLHIVPFDLILFILLCVCFFWHIGAQCTFLDHVLKFLCRFSLNRARFVAVELYFILASGWVFFFIHILLYEYYYARCCWCGEKC